MDQNQTVTIKDVAELAGLSPATVSRVLNQSGYYSENAYERVQQAVQELSYRPNWMARGLKGKSSRLIGLIIPDLSNIFYTALAESILNELRRQGYEMILCVNDEDPEMDRAYLQILGEKNADGVLYAHPAGGSNTDYLHKMVERGTPVVEINRQRERDLLDAVLPNNRQAVQIGMDYLINLGHKRIAMITGGPATSTGGERVEGYKAALRYADLPYDPTLLKVGTFSRSFGEEATSELLGLAEHPTAIFAGSNRIALGSLRVLNDRELRIPEDISFLVFDDAEWFSAWTPPITAVDVAVNEMGQLGVELLMKHIQQPETSRKPVTYQLSTSLSVRESCSPPS